MGREGLGAATAGLGSVDGGGDAGLAAAWPGKAWRLAPACSPWIVAGAGAYFAGPHVTCGSVPATKAIITGRTQPPPGFKSTGTTTTPSGTGKSSGGAPASASDMKAVQMGTATREPVSSRPRLRG